MNKRFIISLAFYLLATSSLFAQEPRQGRPHEEISDELRQVIDDCHTSLNIARPERPTEKPDRNTPPTEEDIAKMKQMQTNRNKIQVCVESKGYHLPDFGGPRHGGPHGHPSQNNGGSSASDESSSSSSVSSGTTQ